jgi:tetratricopeptide (TPR) repeat protein
MKRCGAPWALVGLLLARAALGAAPDDRDRVGELLRELRASLDRGDLDAAVHSGEKAVAEDPRSSEAHDLLGRAYGLKARKAKLLEQVRLAKKARLFFARAVELDPGNAAALADLSTYDMRAPAFLGGGKEKARREAEELARIDPSRGHELLGELAERRKNYPLAEAEYHRAVEESARDVRARRGLSAFLVRHSRFAEARRLWMELKATNPSEPAAPYELAGIALASGQNLEPAVEELQASLALLPEGADDPAPADVHERLGQVYDRLGRSAQAASERMAARRLASAREDWRKEISKVED